MKDINSLSASVVGIVGVVTVEIWRRGKDQSTALSTA
jgi:hypothetical protein